MSELPDWIEEKLEFVKGRRLQQRPVARVFLEEDERPFLTRAQVQSRLKGEYSRGTVLERLKELVEIGVLDNDPLTSGDLYWLVNDKSDWPIPSDVRVESAKDEMTVSEFFGLNSVRITILGIIGVLLGSWLVWIGGFMGGVNVSLYFITPQNLIVVGLLAMFIGWIIGGYGSYQYLSEN